MSFSGILAIFVPHVMQGVKVCREGKASLVMGTEIHNDVSELPPSIELGLQAVLYHCTRCVRSIAFALLASRSLHLH